MSYQGTFKLFELSCSASIAEWIDNCSVNACCERHTDTYPFQQSTGTFFGQVIQAAVVLLDDATSSVGALVSKNILDLLPGFSGVDVADNK